MNNGWSKGRHGDFFTTVDIRPGFSIDVLDFLCCEIHTFYNQKVIFSPSLLAGTCSSWIYRNPHLRVMDIEVLVDIAHSDIK